MTEIPFAFKPLRDGVQWAIPYFLKVLYKNTIFFPVKL
jgi:hypothetical protein